MLCFVVECSTLWSLRRELITLAEGLLVQATSIGALLATLFLAPRARRPALLQLILWNAVAGPFAAIVLIPIARGAPRRSAQVNADPQQPFVWMPEESADQPVDVLCLRLEQGRWTPANQRFVLPLLDCVILGDQGKQLDALRIVAADYDRAFAPVLHEARVSGDAALKVLAATVVASLRKGHADRLAEHDRRCRSGTDAAAHRLALIAELVRYARSGLLDPSSAADQLAVARRLLASGASPRQAARATYRRLLDDLECAELEIRQVQGAPVEVSQPEPSAHGPCPTRSETVLFAYPPGRVPTIPQPRMVAGAMDRPTGGANR